MTIIIYVLHLLWTPYETPQIRRLINNVEVSMIVHAKVSLICFAIVEWHTVDMIMIQFGLWQNISNDPLNLDTLHDIDMRGRTYIFWPYHHRHWIKKWNHLNDYIIQGEVHHGILHENSKYMQWYIHWIKRYILCEGTPSTEVISLLKNFDKLLLLLFIIISNLVWINF